MKIIYLGCSALLLAGLSGSANALLAADAVLNFSSDTFFSFDTNGDGIFTLDERTYINSHNGIMVGSAQAASGSHAGLPDGTETPGIDEAWEFFGSTGLHLSTSNEPTNLLSAAGATATIDMIGWAITWNGIFIPLGSGASSGVGKVTCQYECLEGEAYTLSYEATVPSSHPTFGGAKYRLGLAGPSIALPSGGLSSSSEVTADAGAIFGGTIGSSAVSTVPVPGAIWLFGSGLLGMIGVARRKKR